MMIPAELIGKRGKCPKCGHVERITAVPIQITQGRRELEEDPGAGTVRETADRPMGPVGRPEEIAQAVLYLVSDRSSYVTGVAHIVDGGGQAG